jgi:hypothetical protein
VEFHTRDLLCVFFFIIIFETNLLLLSHTGVCSVRRHLCIGVNKRELNCVSFVLCEFVALWQSVVRDHIEDIIEVVVCETLVS